MAASAVVRVVKIPKRALPEYFACDRRSRRGFNLAKPFEGATFGQFEVSGRYVAYYTVKHLSRSQPSEAELVEVVKVRRRRSLSLHRFFYHSEYEIGSPSRAGISDLAVSPDGGVGWIARPPSVVGVGPLEVRYAAWSNTGMFSCLLDASPDIVPDSLALSASDVYWQRPDGPRVASQTCEPTRPDGQTSTLNEPDDGGVVGWIVRPPDGWLRLSRPH